MNQENKSDIHEHGVVNELTDARLYSPLEEQAIDPSSLYVHDQEYISNEIRCRTRFTHRSTREMFLNMIR
jgi:hypothetical protein